MSNITVTLEKAVAIGVAAGALTESDVLGFVNERLSQKGLALAGAEITVTRRKAKASTSTKADKSSKSEKKSRKAPESVPTVTDGNTHWAAMLSAISQHADGIKSAELKAYLAENGHPMKTAVFHTTMNGLMKKEKAVKKTGKARNYVYSLTAHGSKLLSDAKSEESATSQDEAVAAE